MPIKNHRINSILTHPLHAIHKKINILPVSKHSSFNKRRKNASHFFLKKSFPYIKNFSTLKIDKVTVINYFIIPKKSFSISTKFNKRQIITYVSRIKVVPLTLEVRKQERNKIFQFFIMINCVYLYAGLFENARDSKMDFLSIFLNFS